MTQKNPKIVSRKDKMYHQHLQIAGLHNSANVQNETDTLCLGQITLWDHEQPFGTAKVRLCDASLHDMRTHMHVFTHTHTHTHTQYYTSCPTRRIVFTTLKQEDKQKEIYLDYTHFTAASALFHSGCCCLLTNAYAPTCAVVFGRSDSECCQVGSPSWTAHRTRYEQEES